MRLPGSVTSPAHGRSWVVCGRSAKLFAMLSTARLTCRPWYCRSGTNVPPSDANQRIVVGHLEFGVFDEFERDRTGNVDTDPPCAP